jgi:hypothetical protein
MSLPYIPGFWDEISQSATKLAGQLPAVFQPNEVANKKLEELVRQNPMIMTQIADMDETQRQAFASALGFQDYSKSKIGGIAEGPQLRAQREDEAFFAANPGSKDRAIAARNQTKTAQDLEREDTIFGLGKQEKEQNLRVGAQTEQLNAIKLQEEQEMQTLSSTLKAKFPADTFNVQQAAVDFISGKLDTPELQRITTDPTISGAFNTYIDLYKQRLQLQAQKDVAGLRSPQERMYALQYLQMGVDNAQAKLNEVNGGLKALGGFGNITNPEEYQRLQADRTKFQTQYEQFNSAFTRAMEGKFGKEFKSSFAPGAIENSPGPLANQGVGGNFFGATQGNIPPATTRSPQIEAIRRDYNSGKITATAIRSSARISEEDKAYILGGK